MNDKLKIQEIIDSGILEQYALGLTSQEESKKLISWLEQSEELRSELYSIQNSLEVFARQYSEKVPAHLKQNISNHIENEIQLKNVKASLSKKYLGSILILAIFFSLISFYLWRKYISAEQNYSKLNQRNIELLEFQKLDSLNLIDCRQRLEILRNKNALKINLKGTQLSPQSFAVVYYDSVHLKAYLDILQLPTAPSDKQYQLWAIIAGKPVDLGVFDLPEDPSEIKEIKFLNQAAAFAVTLEPKGGKDQPSLDQLYIIGEVKIQE